MLALTYPEAQMSLGGPLHPSRPMGAVITGPQEVDMSGLQASVVDARGLQGDNLGVIDNRISRMLGQEDQVLDPYPQQTKLWRWAWALLSVLGAATGAYHGYRRNDSIGWALGWAVLGGLFPIVTIPVSLAQGYGQPKS